MTAVIKRIRHKPGEGSAFTFFAEYPVFLSDGDADRSEPPAPTAPADASSGEKSGGKRRKKREPPASSRERLNAIVERFLAAAKTAAKTSGADSVSVTHHIYSCDDRFVSFALDVQRRAGQSLIYLRRFCFNWDCASSALLPLSEQTRYHRKLSRENGGSRDYTISPGTLFMQRNTFTPEAGQSCRRSLYRKFLITAPYDLRALRGGEKRGAGPFADPASPAANGT